jgi:hypothetical protein
MAEANYKKLCAEFKQRSANNFPGRAHPQARDDGREAVARMGGENCG